MEDLLRDLFRIMLAQPGAPTLGEDHGREQEDEPPPALGISRPHPLEQTRGSRARRLRHRAGPIISGRAAHMVARLAPLSGSRSTAAYPGSGLDARKYRTTAVPP